MSIQCFQHVPFEGPGKIEDWARARGHQFEVTRLHDGDPFPHFDDVDFLIVLGGPMGVADEKKHPWMREEIAFIEEAIRERRGVYGICLGAQMVATALGARVTRNADVEVGWHPIELTSIGERSPVLKGISNRFLAFHWHTDTFEIPRGAKHLAQSVGCLNQAFSYGEHVLATQFHLDVTGPMIQSLIQNCPDDLKPGDFVQTPREMTSEPQLITQVNDLLGQLLDRFTGYSGEDLSRR